jgi:predicted ATP-dependent endonuclease of OLD family
MQKEYLYSSTIVSHGIPSQFYFFSEPFNHTTATEGQSKLTSYIFSPDFPMFLRIIFVKLMILKAEQIDGELKVKESIAQTFSLLEKLREPLKKFSIVDDIRLSDKYNIYFDKTIDAYLIQNLIVEFKIKNQWLPFNSLSDGTKRIVYIASEVLAEDGFHIILNSISWTIQFDSRIILLEEPELGLHPHQLSQLMEFICEQAKHKQIIISTHSPIVLDSVSPDELDRIQIADLTPEGTQLRRLTTEQQEKARIYIEETGLLSDYWRFSDLEA